MSKPEPRRLKIGFDRPEEEVRPLTTLELLRSMPTRPVRLDRSFSGPLVFSIADIPDDEDFDDF